MKHLIFISVLIIAIISPVFGQSTNNLSSKQTNSNDEHEIRKILTERKLAFPRTDKKALVAWYEKYVDKDYIRISPDDIKTLSEVLSTLRRTISQPADTANFNHVYEEEQILFFGSTAIATFKITSSGQLKGATAPFTQISRHNNTFAQRNGEWKLVAEQSGIILTSDFLRNVCDK